MLNTFDQSSKTASRRAEREKQLELMNHAANGTGPFAADALDSNWDVADIDMMADLDIDESLALDIMGGDGHAGDVSHSSNNNGGVLGRGRGGTTNALDPDAARAAAMKALQAADSSHNVTSKITGSEPVRKNKPSGSAASRLFGNGGGLSSSENSNGNGGNAGGGGGSAVSRFLWNDDNETRLSSAVVSSPDGGYNTAKQSMFNKQQQKQRNSDREFIMEEYEDDDDDDFAHVHRSGARSGGVLGLKRQCFSVRGQPISRKFVLVAALCFVGFVVVISTVSSNNKNKNEVNNNPPGNAIVQGVPQDTGGGSNTDTPPPAPPQQDNNNNNNNNMSPLKSLLIQKGVIPTSALNNPSSSQSKAIEWLTTQDPDNIDASDKPLLLLQKFALVSLYYSAIESDDEFYMGNYGPNVGELYEDGVAEMNYNVDNNIVEGTYVHRGMDWLSGYNLDAQQGRAGGNNAQDQVVDQDGLPSYCHWDGVTCYGKDDTSTYGGMGLIKALNLTKRGLKGTIPEELPLILDELTLLDLGYNSLTGSIPQTIGSSKQLEQLYLGGNQLTGTIPSSIGDLTQVQDLYLHENFLTGPIPSTIGLLTNLDGLGMYENELSGPIPEELSLLTDLYVLYLDDNRFDGTIPKSMFTQMTNLQDLRLRKNQFHGTIHNELTSMTQLSLLYLDENSLTGSLPGNMGNMIELTQVHLYKNQLLGSLPSSLGLLTNLELLYLDNNLFTGNLGSANLGNGNVGAGGTAGENNLEALYLFQNQFGGNIPAEWGSNLQYLRSLRLNNNNLVGPIPASLGALSRLELLYVDSNQLSGPIPPELGGLESLEQLRLNENSFEGVVVPQDMCQLVEDEQLLELEVDCDKVTCDCCNNC